MSAKSIRFHELARYKMFARANMLADAVKLALGRKGPAPVAGLLLTTEAMVAGAVGKKGEAG